MRGSEKSAATPPSTASPPINFLPCRRCCILQGMFSTTGAFKPSGGWKSTTYTPPWSSLCMTPTSSRRTKYLFVLRHLSVSQPPAVNCYTFVHGTSFQAGAEILREGLLRPTALPKGTRAAASVVYGAATPGDISDYTVETATAQLLKRPKGRSDIIMLCTLATTEAHYKASWSSLTDEAHVCRRRGILRNSDRWGAHAGHLHVQGLIMVGHNR